MENYGYTKDGNTQQQNNVPYKSEKKIPAAILGILVGWLALILFRLHKRRYHSIGFKYRHFRSSFNYSFYRGNFVSVYE